MLLLNFEAEPSTIEKLSELLNSTVIPGPEHSALYLNFERGRTLRNRIVNFDISMHLRGSLTTRMSAPTVISERKTVPVANIDLAVRQILTETSNEN